MTDKKEIYKHQIARLDRLGKHYEKIAVKGENPWVEANKAFNKYCRVQTIKFDLTVQMINQEK